MKILIPVKRVVDYNVKVRIKSDNSGVDIANVKMSMNPFDEIAVEEAVHVKQLVASSSSHWLRNAARQGSVLHLRSFRVEGDGFDE